MSDADLRERPWRLHVLDMIECSEKVLRVTGGMDRQAFISHCLTYDATLHDLQVIGAAARHIPTEVRLTHSEVPWDLLTGTCNQLVLSYLTINDSLVWEFIQEAVPGFLPALRNLSDGESEKGS